MKKAVAVSRGRTWKREKDRQVASRARSCSPRLKGDVHDIGKKHRRCRPRAATNYEVHDPRRGMVPAETILDTAGAGRPPTVVGLSGLITPSLDQMVDAAARGWSVAAALSLPLLIGGRDHVEAAQPP